MGWFSIVHKGSAITNVDFQALLDWLSPEPEAATRRYSEIRAGLVRFFRFRGCGAPELLADETITRVAARLSSFTFDKEVKAVTFFYGFASKVCLEDQRSRARRTVPLEDDDAAAVHRLAAPAEQGENAEIGLDCLQSCLGERDPHEKELIIKYYSHDGAEKLRVRRELADRLNVTPAALHTRVHRLRAALRGCMEECISRGGR